MDPIIKILQENANNRVKGTISFSQKHSKFCDPANSQSKAKFALFSYIPNHIQLEKNRELIELLYSQERIDEQVKNLLINMFGKQGNTFPGVGRIRGCFKTLKEATKQAEYLVQEVDPFSSVMVCMTGVPFPLVEGGYSKDTKLAEDAVDDVVCRDAVKKKATHDRKIQEMKKREEKILQDHHAEASPLDLYIQKRVKFAQVTMTLTDMKKKLEDYSDALLKVVKEIKEIELERPDLKDMYLDSYKDACKAVGIVPSEGFLDLLTQEF